MLFGCKRGTPMLGNTHVARIVWLRAGDVFYIGLFLVFKVVLWVCAP